MPTKPFDVAALGELLIDFTENGRSEQGNTLFEANPDGGGHSGISHQTLPGFPLRLPVPHRRARTERHPKGGGPGPGGRRGTPPPWPPRTSKGWYISRGLAARQCGGLPQRGVPVMKSLYSQPGDAGWARVCVLCGADGPVPAALFCPRTHPPERWDAHSPAHRVRNNHGDQRV